MKKGYKMLACIAGLLLLVSGTVGAQTTANVTFQVDMRATMTAGAFNPAGGDIVEVAGSFNNWAGDPADTLKDADGDSIFTGTFALSGDVGTTKHEFKFLQRTAAGGDVWEDAISNRALIHPPADTTLPVTVFDVPYPNTANVTFQLDLSVQIDQGNFDPAADKVEVAGGFNGWAGDPTAFLDDSDGDSVYTGTWPLTGIVGQDTHEFKYLQRKGDGTDVWESVDNRKLAHPAADVVLNPVPWDDDSGQAKNMVMVTFQVDMRATMSGGAFNPAGGDIVEVAGNFNNWASDPADTLNDADGDSIFTGTFELSGDAGTTKHEFKFLQRLAAGGDVWEDAIGNRVLIHPPADTTLPVTVFDVPYPNTANVTFQLDLSVQIDKGNFDPAADKVEVAGGFNGWAGDPAAFLDDSDGDSVYTGTWALTGIVGQDTHEFKYLQRKGDGSDAWESVDNRKLAHPAADVVLDPVFWDDDPGLAENTVLVTFQVDMNVKMQEPETGDTYVFNPAIDIVEVAGSFNAWQDDPADTLKDADGDSIYSGTFALTGSEGFTIHEYKFLIRSPSGDIWEDNIGSNRFLAHPTADTTLDAVFYDGDEVVSVPAVGNILFTVDAAVLQDFGIFRREAGDVMWTLGSFTGWQGALGDPAREFAMTRIPPGETHQKLYTHDGLTGDQLPYKFYMEWADSAFYADKFGRPWDANWGWEEPATLGGADRRHTFVAGNQVGREGFWGDFPPQGVIPAGDTVTVTLSVDMNPAMTPGGFDPATDGVFYHNRSPLWTIMTNSPHNSADSSKAYTDSDGDGVYTATFDVIGPAPYDLHYDIQAGTSDDDHGFAGFGRHRVRYIQPVNGEANNFPRAYTFPQDVWNPSTGPPHVVEEPPFSPITHVEAVEDANIPEEYTLFDNYPNPFNPSTTIEFDVAKAGIVEIAIYNIMGQRIRTLTNKHFAQAGRYKVDWNGRDGLGRPVGSGVYFYRLKAGEIVKNKKMIMVK